MLQLKSNTNSNQMHTIWCEFLCKMSFHLNVNFLTWEIVNFFPWIPLHQENRSSERKKYFTCALMCCVARINVRYNIERNFWSQIKKFNAIFLAKSAPKANLRDCFCSSNKCRKITEKLKYKQNNMKVNRYFATFLKTVQRHFEILGISFILSGGRLIT